jgi:hypothetical protein
VTVECLHAGEDFAVVSARDQDLGARADGGLEDREGSSGELVLLDLCDFILSGQQSVSVCCHERRLVSVRQLLSRLRE